MFYQQGDIIIEKIDKLPEDVKKIDSLILEEGEESGHFHALVEGKEKSVEVYENAQGKFFQTNWDTLLTHQEHAPAKIEPGIYKVRKVQEFDNTKLKPRPVRD